MDFLNDMQKKVQEFASENATTLLTAGGVVGAVGTGVLAFRAGYHYSEIVREAEDERLAKVPADEQGDTERENAKLTKAEKAAKTWVYFVPPVLAGGATVTAIIMSHRMSANKAAALAAAYGLSQKQFEEYKAKVEERLNGPKKDRPSADEIDAELAQDRANQAPRPGSTVIIGSGNVLCFDEAGGRYFQSSMEKLKKAENLVNEEIIHCCPVTLNEFYDKIGLPPTTYGDQVGFNQDHLLKLDIKAILNPDDESTPVLAVDFNGGPVANYTSLHQ